MSTTVSEDEWSDTTQPERPLDSYVIPYQAMHDPISLQPAIKRWWWWFILAAIISAPLAFFGAQHFAADSYVYGTRLIFNRSHFGAPLYEPPDIYAIAALSSSPALLHELKHELRLEPDVERLESLLEPDVRGGSTVMAIQLEWDSAEKSKEILDWINEKLVLRVQALRDKRIDRSLADLKTQLAKYEQESVESHDQIVRFRQEHNTFGVLDQLRTIQSEQGMFEKGIAIAESEKESLELQIASFGQRIAEIQNQDEEELTEDDLDRVDLTIDETRSREKERAQREANTKYAAVLDQIKQNNLQKSIREERTRALLSTRLDLKRRALADARRLYDRQLIPQIEVQTLADEVSILELELIGTEKLKEWEQELETVSGRMDESMLEAAKKGEIELIAPLVRNGSTQVRKDSTSSFDDLREKWQVQFETKKKLIARLHKAAERKQQQKLELKEVLPQAERLAQQHIRAETMRSRLEGQVTDLEMLRRSDSNLLAILDPPSPGPIPVKSNKKKLMVAFYALATCILCAPIVIKELLAPTVQHRQSPIVVRPR